MVQTFNRVEFENLNAIGTKVKVSYFNDSGDLVREIEEECSSNEFICNFNGVLKENNEIVIDNKLCAKFFTNESHFNSQVGAYDYLTFSTKIPLKYQDYDSLYDDIYSRMKLFSNDYIEGLPIEHREQFMKNHTDGHKKKFLIEFVSVMLNFQLVRPKVIDFIKDYLNKNPKYCYVRIFTTT